MALAWVVIGILIGAVAGWWVASARRPSSVAPAEDENLMATSALPETLADSCVDDVMVPRLHIQALDLSDSIDDLQQTIAQARHRFLPVFEGTLDHIVGMLDLREALRLMPLSDHAALRNALRPAYYVPSGTPLLLQFEQFRAGGQKVGLVVDEYGELEGMVSLTDIGNEAVLVLLDEGRSGAAPLRTMPDEGVIIDAGLPLRALNRRLLSQFPLDGPKTLSGLIIETLGEIPEAGRAFDFYGYHIEVLQTKNHTVRVVKLSIAGTNRADTTGLVGNSALQTDQERALSQR